MGHNIFQTDHNIFIFFYYKNWYTDCTLGSDQCALVAVQMPSLYEVAFSGSVFLTWGCIGTVGETAKGVPATMPR